LLVNDDTCGGIEQVRPDIARLPNGFLAVWEDFRMGDYNADVYCQRLDSLGRSIGRNRAVNRDTASRNVWRDYRQQRPAVAALADGRALVVWEDYRGGTPGIRCHALDTAALSFGSDVPISPATPGQTDPDIAAGADEFVIVWVQSGPAGTEIRGAKRDLIQDRSPELVLSDCAPTDSCVEPAVAISDNGFVVVWIQTATDRVLRLRRFGMNGEPHGPSVALAATMPDHPGVACAPSGSGVVVWAERHDRLVKVQPFAADGRLEAAWTIRLSEQGTPFEPSVSAAGSGNGFVLAWVEARDQVSVRAAALDESGGLLGYLGSLDSTGPAAQNIAIAAGAAGRLGAVWEERSEGDANITGIVGSVEPQTNADERRCVLSPAPGVEVCADRRVSAVARPGDAGRLVRLNDDRASAIQDFPVVVSGEDRRRSVFWFDYRHGPGQPAVYCRRFDRNLRPQGGSFPVSETSGRSGATFFWVAANRSGKIVAAWQDTRNGDPDIYAQVYDSLGRPEGGNFRVNDDAAGRNQTWPGVAVNDSGAFVVVWSDDRGGFSGVFAQCYDRENRRAGGNFRVAYASQDPSVRIGPAGDFWIAWRSGDGIRLQHFGADRQPRDTALRFGVGTRPVVAAPELAQDQDAGLLLVWMDARRGSWEVIGQKLSDGRPAGPELLISEPEWLCDHFLPNVVWNGIDHYCVTWTDFRIPGNLDVRCRFLGRDGVPVESSFVVNTDPGPVTCQWAYGSASALGDDVVFAWIDNRNARSWDVYVRQGLPTQTPAPEWKSLTIMPATVRDFCRLRAGGPLSGSVRLSIYDATGRRCRAFEWDANSGSPFIELDCRSLAAGAYFARLRSRGRNLQGRFVKSH
jgi:hypothetical protein